MEIHSDSTPSAPPAEEKLIKIHPLAIIGISDHHTRVVTGGSALPRDAPVVGLLFGYRDGWTVVVVDADEMEHPGASGGGRGSGGGASESPAHDHGAAIRKKIELHQKVFPRHEVIGWYRVQRQRGAHSSSSPSGKGSDEKMDMTMVEEEGPSEEDLRMNQTEMKEYCGSSVESPLFVLMNAAAPAVVEGSVAKKPAASSLSSSSPSTPSAGETLEIDERLPLTLYETLVTEGGPGAGGGSSAVFVNVDFELETYEPERIAVEKVFKTQPPPSQRTRGGGGRAASSKDTANDGAELRKAGKKNRKDDHASKDVRGSDTPSAPPPSELDIHLDSLKSSIRSMNMRVEVLLEFLHKVERGDLPPDDTLLRTVDGLVRQLPFVIGALEESSASMLPSSSGGRRPAGELESDYDDTMLLSYLAAVAKTARTVHGYTEKFRIAHESNSREMRRSAF